MDFDEWYKEAKRTNDCGFTAKNFFEAGQQSKQAEIDELQKRIDDALDHTVNHGGYDDLTHIINILKGKQK